MIIITKSIIEDAINKSISVVKCSQHLTLSNKVSDSFNKFHGETCGKKIRKTEKGYVTDVDGNVVYTTNGTKTELNKWNWTTIKDLYEEVGELHVTHNHPRVGGAVAECLSSGDVQCLFYTYRPYGKRPDGSEGYLTGEEGVYPLKSMSCESPNGSRMTLVRGDNFNHSDEGKATSLGAKLSNYWAEYDNNYYENVSKIASEHSINDFKSIDDFKEFVHNEAIKKVGVFDKKDEFKQLQEDFRSLNCKLMYEFPFDYRLTW